MSTLKLNFENDRQRRNFVSWFADAGGENDYWSFFRNRKDSCPLIDLVFKNNVVTEIDFKVMEE